MNGARAGKATIAVAVFLCLLASASTELTWEFTNNKAALCNDFTRAGFFHRNVSGEDKKWVIYLESGSMCYSNETCNRRYFQSHVRKRYSSDDRGPFSNFDTSAAWENTGAAGTPLAEFVNPLMRSLYCFRNDTRYFKDNERFAVKGTDVLSSDCDENPTFCHHGHVLLPYCSSDVWLGGENATSREYPSSKGEPCSCEDRECFKYNPTSEGLQFTFRGRTIFQSVVETVDEMYNLHEAEEIVLMGSSAGGVGVLNLAKWVRQKYPNVTIKVVIDSSWFINFRDSINQAFGTLINSNTSAENSSDVLIQFLESHEPCKDMRLGYPCCLSAHCILTESSPTTKEPYYPRDVSVFFLTSLYDIFLLANSLSGLVLLPSDQYSTTALAVQFISTVGEYGGAMNASVIETAVAARSTLRFSYYATQCFQHIYFATSTLRESILGSEPVEVGPEIVTFRHTIESGVWGDSRLAYYEGQSYTIRDALNWWYHNGSDIEGGVVFRDQCTGPRCNDGCPEELVLQDQGAKGWPIGVRIMIAVFVVAIAVICLLLKVYCCVWLKCLHRKQQNYLDEVQPLKDVEAPTVMGKPTRLKREFPYCTDDKAISVACLDLHYYVTADMRMQLKDRNTQSPLTLSGLLPDDEPNPTEPSDEDRTKQEQTRFSKVLNTGSTKRKRILNGISAYFNPKELIAIMGPSGCGKTTFLDLLTGRRKIGTFMGDLFVNGTSIQENRNWYVSNTGYVLQLAAPYYEELTVRENLTLAAWVKLHVSTREKFERVEQVMDVTGLLDLADTVVGGATGPGLSGGQKRRLVVALQLLKIPSVIFLDEPTSGLDATASAELLTHLNDLAASNRTVVLTIHQPRLEIFHMFHRIVVLSDGKVAYQGVPDKAYEVFVNALHSCYLRQSLVIPDLEDHNPADVIMDMLGNKKMRQVVTKYYEASGEPALVSSAIAKARFRERLYTDASIDAEGTLSSKFGTLKQALAGSRQAGRTHNYSIVRLAALEARAMKRASLAVILYLPIIFFGYGFLLGTVYFQQTTPFLIMSGFCVYSVASALFMFPALYGYFTRALDIYTFERADSAGRASDLVIQPFIRFISMAFFPVIICAGVLYLLLVDRLRWDFLVFVQVAVVNVALNQVWTALLIWLILTFPQKAIRLSPVISALAGFTSGFFIPINEIPWWYRWLCYINPNYYGFSASAVLLLSDFESDCERNDGSQFECYASSGQYVLDSFSFGDINPYENIAILLGMTLFFLVMAVVSNWIRFLSLRQLLMRVNQILQNTLFGGTLNANADLVLYHPPQEQQDVSDSESSQGSEVIELGPRVEDEKSMEGTNETAQSEAKVHILESNKKLELHHHRSPEPHEDTTQSREKGRSQTVGMLQRTRTSLYLRDGRAHSVWKPKRHSEHKLVSQSRREVRKQSQDLRERQQNLLSRVEATRDVLKEQKEELARCPEENQSEVEEREEEKEVQGNDQTHTSIKNGEGRWQYAIKRVLKEKAGESKTKDLKRTPWHFHDIVTQYIETMSEPLLHSDAQPTVVQERKRAPTSPCVSSSSVQDRVVPLRQWKSQYYASKKARQDRMKQFSTEPSMPKPLDTIAEEDTEISSPDTTTFEIMTNSNSHQSGNPSLLPRPDLSSTPNSSAQPDNNPSNPQV